jgi:osmotically-inducible protein OsmY
MRKFCVMFCVIFYIMALCVLLQSTTGCRHAENSNNTAGGAANIEKAESSDVLMVRTELALLANPVTSGYGTDVTVKDGVVTLQGKVDTDDAKSQAAITAGQVQGVRKVDNALQVAPEAKRQEVSVSDDKIQDAIQTLMDKDPRLSDMSISAVSKSGGVTLDGTADSGSQLLYAAQAIKKVPGVKSVATSGVSVKE